MRKGLITLTALLITILLLIFGKGRFLKTNPAPQTDNSQRAIDILRAKSKVQQMENIIIARGAQPFFTADRIQEDVVQLSLREGFPNDAHTNLVAVFNVNIKTSAITVRDVLTNQDIPYGDWSSN